MSTEMHVFRMTLTGTAKKLLLVFLIFHLVALRPNFRRCRNPSAPSYGECFTRYLRRSSGARCGAAESCPSS